MAEIYAAWITTGKKLYADVPKLLKEKVKSLLAAAGLDENGSPLA